MHVRSQRFCDVNLAEHVQQEESNQRVTKLDQMESGELMSLAGYIKHLLYETRLI